MKFYIRYEKNVSFLVTQISPNVRKKKFKKIRMDYISITSYTNLWDTNRIGFGQVFGKPSSPYLFKPYQNLNYIKDLSAIATFF